MMKHTSDVKFEKMLNSISYIIEQKAPEYFYTRLKSRLESELKSNEMDVNDRSIYIIYVITVFIIMSIIFNVNYNTADKNYKNNIESLASSYDQNISN
jgi:hypothetical protein